MSWPKKFFYPFFLEIPTISDNGQVFMGMLLGFAYAFLANSI